MVVFIVGLIGLNIETYCTGCTQSLYTPIFGWILKAKRYS